MVELCDGIFGPFRSLELDKAEASIQAVEIQHESDLVDGPGLLEHFVDLAFIDVLG